MSWTVILLLAGGLTLLVLGAEVLVRGAARLAAIAGIPPLLVGLTVVSLCTSAPEFAVCIKSAMSSQGDVALGNIVGSNIFNVLCILGLSALVAPLPVAQRLLRLDVPLMVLASLVVLLLALDSTIGRFDGFFLLAGAVVYFIFVLRQGQKESRKVKQEYEEQYGSAKKSDRSARVVALQMLLVIVGVAMLVQGAEWLVQGAVSIASALGVSELIIGLTIIAAGTGLPELAASVVAGLRGEKDIAVGNAIGSCIFNLIAVLGLTAAIAPEPLMIASQMLKMDLPVMLASAVACLPIFYRGWRIDRWEGALFLFFYAAYVAELVLISTSSEFEPTLRTTLLFFALPLSAVTLLVLVLRQLKKERTAESAGA
ncbi:calcium/sodium antiporter [bacterium]|nr:calcium/sodium antiporter [bacterium]